MSTFSCPTDLTRACPSVSSSIRACAALDEVCVSRSSSLSITCSCEFQVMTYSCGVGFITASCDAEVMTCSCYFVVIACSCDFGGMTCSCGFEVTTCLCGWGVTVAGVQTQHQHSSRLGLLKLGAWVGVLEETLNPCREKNSQEETRRP